MIYGQSPFAPLRRLMAVALALVIALTSSHMVLARSHAAAVDRVVICSGYGVMTIDLDADGNPIGPVHLCPECMAAHGFAVLADPARVLRPETTALSLAWALVKTDHYGRAPIALRARAAPFNIV